MVGPGTDVGDSQRRVRTAGTAVRVTTSVLAFCYTAAIIVGFHWRGIETVVTLLVTAGLCLPYIVTRHRRDRGSRGGRPVGLDTEAYRGRNVIERDYSDVKQWRGLATRYDKLGLTYRAGAVLRAIIQ